MKSSVMGHALYLGKISPERILFEDMSWYKLMCKHDLMLTLHVLEASITESSTRPECYTIFSAAPFLVCTYSDAVMPLSMRLF